MKDYRAFKYDYLFNLKKFLNNMYVILIHLLLWKGVLSWHEGWQESSNWYKKVCLQRSEQPRPQAFFRGKFPRPPNFRKNLMQQSNSTQGLPLLWVTESQSLFLFLIFSIKMLLEYILIWLFIWNLSIQYTSFLSLRL